MNKGFVNNNNYLEKFSSLQKNLSCLNETSKQECVSKIATKLSDPKFWYQFKNVLVYFENVMNG